MNASGDVVSAMPSLVLASTAPPIERMSLAAYGDELMTWPFRSLELIVSILKC